MNKYVRGILFFLFLVGLGGEFYFAAKVLSRRFAIQTALVKSIADSTQAVAAEEKARLDRLAARSNLAIVKNGWSFEWEFLPGGGGGIQPVPPGRLNVSGLGRNNGLNPVPAAAGSPEVPPTVHVYALNPDNTSVYLGEFVARIDQLQATTCVLEPTWRPRPEELTSWNFSNGARFRREVPPGQRNAFAGLNQTILRSLEKEALTDIHIQQQTSLNAAAAEGLDKRKKELTGDPDGPDVPDHPEYRVGLVVALRDSEEERNAVQAAVDFLRRALLQATQKRQSLLDTLRQLPPALTKSGTTTVK
ncbi:MAG: hypothetical protein ACKO2P_04100 [Planctomycetota bacterium]